MHRVVKQKTPFVYMVIPKSWKVQHLFPQLQNYALMWLFLFNKDIHSFLLLQNNILSLYYIFLCGLMNRFALLPFLLHDSLVLNIWSITIHCHQLDILATSVVITNKRFHHLKPHLILKSLWSIWYYVVGVDQW